MTMQTATFLCFLLFYLCNGQICTSPVHNNSAGVTIRGPCPSSQIIVPVGSIIKFNCSYGYNGQYLTFWNITNIEPVISHFTPPPNSGIAVTISGSGNGFTTLTFPVTNRTSLDVQCGLCNNNKGECSQSSLQPTVISLPVQVISFGK